MSEIIDIPLSDIEPNPYQPRKRFSKEALIDLTTSIRDKGILLPLIVSKVDNGRYQLIAGERRYRSALALKMKTVPVIIREVADQDKLELALIENVQRQALNPIDEAQAYSHLKEDFGLSQDVIAQKMGKSRSSIGNILRLLELPSYIKEQLAEGFLSVGHAKILLTLNSDPKKQKELYLKLIDEGLSVNRSAKEARTLNTHKDAVSADAEIKSWEQELTSHLAAKAIIDQHKGKGKLTVSFYSLEELKNIIRSILGN